MYNKSAAASSCHFSIYIIQNGALVFVQEGLQSAQCLEQAVTSACLTLL